MNKCSVENYHRKIAFDYFVGGMEDSVTLLVSFDWSVEDVVIAERVMPDSV